MKYRIECESHGYEGSGNITIHKINDSNTLESIDKFNNAYFGIPLDIIEVDIDYDIKKYDLVNVDVVSKENNSDKYISINTRGVISNDSSRYHDYTFTFIMPKSDVKVKLYFKNKEDNSMPVEENKNQVIDTFEIPDELAKELSENLIKQTIRQRTLQELIEDPVKYEAAEKLLIPVVSRVEAIKLKITKEYVPDKYNSIQYMWNYDGYEVDGNRVQIIKID